MKALPNSLVVAVFSLLFASAWPPSLQAKDENGLRVEVRKTTLEKNDDRSGGYSDKIDRTLGLKIYAKNISLKDMPEGKIEWIMLVERWGWNPRRIERYKGTDTLPALRAGEEANFTFGESQIGGYRAWSGRYQDTIEGWSVVITHDGKPTSSIQSSTSFDRLNAKAKDAPQN